MSKREWNVTRQKAGSEIWVSNAYEQIYICEDYANTTKERVRRTILIAHICKNALNKDNPYDK